MGRGPQAATATPLLRDHDPCNYDPVGEQPRYGHSMHPQGDSVGVGCDEIVEGAPAELGEMEVQLPPTRRRPRANGSKLAYATADVAPAAYVAPSPAAALLHLRRSHLP